MPNFNFSQDYGIVSKSKSPSRNMVVYFGKTHKDYPVNPKVAQKQEKSALIDMIDRLGQNEYSHWIGVGKTSGGGELIPVNQLKSKLPEWVTNDVEKVAVFRFKGNKCRIIGVYDSADNVFDVIFVDYKLKLYEH